MRRYFRKIRTCSFWSNLTSIYAGKNFVVFKHLLLMSWLIVQKVQNVGLAFYTYSFSNIVHQNDFFFSDTSCHTSKMRHFLQFGYFRAHIYRVHPKSFDGCQKDGWKGNAVLSELFEYNLYLRNWRFPSCQNVY